MDTIQINKMNSQLNNPIQSNKNVMNTDSQMHHKTLIELSDGRLAYSYLHFIKIYQKTHTQMPLLLCSERDGIKSLIQLKDQTIVSGYNNGVINLWNYELLQSTSLTSSHSKAVICLLQSNYYNHLISGSIDCLVKIWDLSSKQCLTTLNHHHNSVNCLLELNDSRLATGSFDNTIHIFNQPKYTLSIVITNHCEIFSMIQVDIHQIAFGTIEKIKFHNLFNTRCNLIITNSHLKVVSYLLKLSNKMLACCSDNMIFVWKLFSENYLEQYRFKSEDIIYSMIELNNNRLAYISSGNEIHYITLIKKTKDRGYLKKYNLTI